MGRRHTRVTLSNLEFDLVPKGFDKAGLQDDSGPKLQHVYAICHQAMFGKSDPTSLYTYEDDILANARDAGLSLKMYVLCSMVAYVELEMLVSENTSRNARGFHPSVLARGDMPTRARTYANICRHRYGAVTFDKLARITKNEAMSDFEARLLDSEIQAGRFVVHFKIFQPGPPYEALYEKLELNLDPHWLALEPNYFNVVLLDHIKNPKRNRGVDRQRSSVLAVRTEMARHRDVAIANHQCRESIIKPALSKVLHGFQTTPDDFEMEPAPVTDPMHVWIAVGQALQHLECLRHVRQGQSVFSSLSPVGG